MSNMREEAAATMRGLAEGDAHVLAGLFGHEVEGLSESGLDPSLHALARFAALVAVSAPPTEFRISVATAQEVGVTLEQLLGVVIAVAPIIGTSRLIVAAQELMLAVEDGRSRPGPPGAR